jgi:hypothetical protein
MPAFLSGFKATFPAKNGGTIPSVKTKEKTTEKPML